MKYWLIVVTCLFSPALVAQTKIDSLTTVYAEAIQKSKFEKAAYHAALIGNEWVAIARYDTAIAWYHRAIRFSKRNEFIASTLNSLGVMYNFKGYPDSCVRYYKEALNVYAALRDTVYSPSIEINLAIVYKNIGWYDEALETSLTVLPKIENKKPDKALASLYSTIGGVYLHTGDLARSVQYHKRSLQVRHDIAYDRGVGQSLTNIGEVFIALKRYDSAHFYLFEAAEIKRKLENKSDLGSTLNQIGRVYLLMDNTNDAEPPLIEALSIKHAAGERASEADVMNNIAHLRIKQGRYADADNVLKKAEQLLRQSSDFANLQRNLELEILLQKKLSNYATALQYSEELALVKDSLLNVEKAEIVGSMESRFEAQKKEKQIVILQNEKLVLDADVKSRETSITTLGVVVVIALVFIVFIYFQNRSLRAAKNSNELLLKEVNHRVKNNLQIISTLFRIPYQGLEDSNALRLIKSGESRVNAMALIHRQLSEKTAYRTIQLDSFLGDLVNYLDQSFAFTNNGGQLDVTCPATSLDIDNAIPLALVVNEVLANSMKHSKATKISVVVSKHDKGMELEISDNGIGLPSSPKANPNGFGLRLINMMTKELRGSLQTITSNGTKTIINIPVI